MSNNDNHNNNYYRNQYNESISRAIRNIELDLKKLTLDVYKMHEDDIRAHAQLAQEIAKLKVRAGTWGAVAGLAVTVAAPLVAKAFGVF
jgi:hypothetical protein